MPRCCVCDGEDFDLQDGLYYCTECSTQSQEIREEAVEDEYAEGTWSGRVVKGGRDLKQNHAGEDCGPDWRMAEAYNIIVKEQVGALVALGASTDFAEVSLQLWSRHLKQCEQAFVTDNQTWTPRLSAKPYSRDVQIASGDAVGYCLIAASGENSAILATKQKSSYHRHAKGSSAKQVTKNVKRRKQKKDNPHDPDHARKEEEEEEGNEGEPTEVADQTREQKPGGRGITSKGLDSKRKKKANILNEDYRFSHIALDTYEKKGSKVQVIARKQNHYRLLDSTDMLTAISIPSLALRITQDTILLSDISRWIKEGHIPYLESHRLLPSEWRVFPHDKVFFSPKTPPTVKSLHYGVRRLSNFLGLLRVPVLDVRYVVARYVADMNLPFGLLSVANIVIDQFMSNKHSLHCMGSLLEFHAGVVILFVLKHIFGLDNKNERMLSNIASKHNLENAETGGEKMFVWSEWEEQMEPVISCVRTRNPRSISFSPDNCQDVGIVLSYIQNSRIEASSDLDSFSKTFRAKVEENLMFIKKNLSNLRQNEAHSVATQREQTEPANSFPIRTILGQLGTRTGQRHMDFSHRKVDSARSPTYWFCHSAGFRCASTCGSRVLPSSFMTAFHVLQQFLDWNLKDVMAQMAELEMSVFALQKSRAKCMRSFTKS